MFCPSCRTEYREGFTTCTDCGITLLPELPPNEETPNSDLDVAFETTDPNAIAAAEEMLTEAGIPFATDGEDGSDLFAFAPGFNPMTPVQIEVPSERLEEARELLEEGLTSAAPLSEDADVGPPPAEGVENEP
ncbi:MAG: DUF2007 domain-containing protein [Acidobacteriota bacterium]